MDLSKPRLPVHAQYDKSFLMPIRRPETGMNPDFLEHPMAFLNFPGFAGNGKSSVQRIIVIQIEIRTQLLFERCIKLTITFQKARRNQSFYCIIIDYRFRFPIGHLIPHACCSLYHFSFSSLKLSLVFSK
jgi:hypothetical protein